MGEHDESETSAERPKPHPREQRGALRIAGDRYHIGDALGRGGMGEVLAARDEQIGREVAIKRIRADAPSDRSIERFVREARIQGRLEHPAIVPVHEIGRDVQGLPYFAMKKLAGTTLAKMMELPLEQRIAMRQRMLRAFVEVCLAIEFAHVHGVVHRDLKPSNIMLGDFGEVYVLDWGVAKILGEHESGGEFADSGEGLTVAGSIVGTPGYMSPEQALAASDIDARSDVYALGRVLEDMLGADAPPELADLAKRATADDRGARVQTARELADTVQRFLDGDRDLAHRRTLAREHLERANAAIAKGTGEQERKLAIAAAGRALALDPENAEAGALVAQLVLHPEPLPPAQLAQGLESDAREWITNAAKMALWGQLVLVPCVITMFALHLNALALAIVAVLVFAAVTDVLAMRGWRPFPFPWLVGLIYAPVLAILSYTYGPPLIAPGMAAVIGVNLAAHPYSRGRASLIPLFLVLAGSVLLPFALGELGILRRFAQVLGNGDIVIHSPGFDVGAWASPMMALYVMLLLVGAIAFGHVMGATERKLRTELHTISWHLRQLLPQK